MNAKDLKSGTTLVWETREGNEDWRQASVEWNNHLNKFVLWFNGAIISSSKTLKTVSGRLNKLIEKWDLVPVTTEFEL